MPPRKKRGRKFKRDAASLKAKAISSLRCALDAFNCFTEDCRQTNILLGLQHAGEMLLKAGLVQKGQPIFDRQSGKSKGFGACLNLASEHLKATPEEQGAFRSVDALRDGEQHWLIVVAEPVMYLQARAFLTAFDDLLHRVFGERLADHIPGRVLPISTEPIPADVVTLFDAEYARIKDLLAPGKRKRDEALARIREMLCVEGHVADVEINEKDVARVEKGIKAGKALAEVFPRLSRLAATVTGVGPEVRVVISKREGVPVHIVRGDDPTAAFAVREVDLQNRFKYSATEIARMVGLTGPKTVALRQHLGMDDDPEMVHEFTFGSQRLKRYSDRALEALRAAKADVDIDAVWANYNAAMKRRH